MRDWKACHDVCQTLLQSREHMRDAEAYSTMFKARLRLEEERTGIYDWTSILELDSKDIICRDAADFTVLVEARSAPRMGRGLFAKTNIEEGSILMVEKAFEYANGAMTGVNVVHDLSAAAVEVYIGENLLAKTLFKLQNMGPDWRAKFFQLYSGDYKHLAGKECPKIDGQVVIDAFLVHKILRLNSMGFGPPSQLDRDRGIWITSSFLNHACSPNCELEFHGDMLLLRPKQDIEEGQQLTVSYISIPDLAVSERKEMLKRNWGFDCACDECK